MNRLILVATLLLSGPGAYAQIPSLPPLPHLPGVPPLPTLPTLPVGLPTLPTLPFDPMHPLASIPIPYLPDLPVIPVGPRLAGSVPVNYKGTGVIIYYDTGSSQPVGAQLTGIVVQPK